MASRGGRIQGKVAVITGAGGAIGRAIALRFVQEGAKIAISDVNEAYIQETVAAIIETCGADAKESILSDIMDISKEADWKSHYEKVAKKWNHVDILVNNAVQFVFGTVEEATGDDWDRALGTNIKGMAFGCKHAIPLMKKAGKGSIVNIASISSFIAQPELTPYNTTKGAVIQLTRCIAMDYGKHEIRVNAVCPGPIDTPATTRHAIKIGVPREQLVADSVKDLFLKRMGTVDECASAVLFLASDESSFTTGSMLMVDGGYIAH